MSEPQKNDWFNTGQAAVAQATLKSGGGGAFRFYLKAGTEAQIIFLDGDNTPEEPAFNYREHQYDAAGARAPHYASCVGAARGCAFCKAGLQPYEAWPFTIIQIAPSWTDRDGKERTNERRLLVVKKELMQRLLRYLQQHGGLTGTIWTVYRSNKKAYTAGDDWQFKQKVGKDGMKADDRRKAVAEFLKIDPERTLRIAYAEELRPQSEQELLAGGADIEATKARAASWGPSTPREPGGGSREGSAAPAGGGRGKGAEVEY